MVAACHGELALVQRLLEVGADPNIICTGWELGRRQYDDYHSHEGTALLLALEHGHLIVKERRHFSQTYVPNHKEVRVAYMRQLCRSTDGIVASTITSARARS